MRLKSRVIALTLGMTLVFSGCGGGAAGGGDSLVDKLVRLAGSVDLSSLASSDQTLLRSRGYRGTGDVIVKLYEIDENGEQKATDYVCTVSSDGSYDCPEVAANKEYVVRYVKDMGNGKVLELKANASVGEEAVTDAKVDPITTMVVQALVKAVKEALVGVTNDANLIKNVIKAVKDSTTTTMQTLVKSGALKVPSMVVEADFTDISSSGTQTQNKNLDKAAGEVLGDESIAAKLKAATNESQESGFATLTNEDKLKAIFKAIGWGEGVPGWVLSMFGSEYDLPKTNGMKFSALEASLKSEYSEVNDTTIGEHEWEIQELIMQGVIDPDTDDVNTTFKTISSNIYDAFETADVTTALKTELTEFYRIKAKAFEDRTADELDFISGFPVAVTNVFPESFVDTLTADSVVQNMGQLFVMMGLMEQIVEDIAQEKINEYASTDKEYRIKWLRFLNQNQGTNIVEDILGDKMQDPAFIAKHDKVSIGEMQLNNGQYWDETTGQETSGVMLDYASLSKMKWDIGQETPDSAKVTSATLTYPTASGTKTVDLDVSVSHGIQLSYSPYSMSMDGGDMPEGGDMSEGGEEPTEDLPTMEASFRATDDAKILTDAITGDYTLSVTYDGTTLSKTQRHIVLTGVSSLYPKMVSPREFPRYPEGNATTEQSQAFEAEMQKFWEVGVSNFVPNHDGNTTLKGAVFSWEEPAGLSSMTLPEGVIPAYQVYINLTQMDANGDGNVTQEEQESCWMNWDKCNKTIYDSWRQNTPITGTTFKVPAILEQTTGTDEYSIGVSMIFIDQATGENIGHGGHSHAQFTVGEGTALSGTETVTFSGSITLESGVSYPENAKVAIIAESHGYNETTDTWEHTIETIKVANVNTTDNNYTIDINASTLAENASGNKNINVVFFGDSNTDDEVDAYVDDSNTGDDIRWSEGTWMWIENWGELRINVDSVDNGHQFYRVAKDKNISVTNIDFKIW